MKAGKEGIPGKIGKEFGKNRSKQKNVLYLILCN